MLCAYIFGVSSECFLDLGQSCLHNAANISFSNFIRIRIGTSAVLICISCLLRSFELNVFQVQVEPSDIFLLESITVLSSRRICGYFLVQQNSVQIFVTRTNNGTFFFHVNVAVNFVGRSWKMQ